VRLKIFIIEEVFMSFGKLWKVPKATILALAANADTNDDCFIEVWHENSDSLADCDLYLKLSSTWSDSYPEDDFEDDPDS
jgi:hypothetical protein